VTGPTNSEKGLEAVVLDAVLGRALDGVMPDGDLEEVPGSRLGADAIEGAVWRWSISQAELRPRTRRRWACGGAAAGIHPSPEARMGKRYSIADAQGRLRAIVHDAEKGDVAELTRRGKPVAVVLSIADYERLRGAPGNFWSALQEFRASHDLAGLDVEAVFEGARDRSPGRDSKW
jgi:antitoxin Phd